MTDELVIGIMLGMFIVAGPQVTIMILKLRKQLATALNKAGLTMEDLKPSKKEKS